MAIGRIGRLISRIRRLYGALLPMQFLKIGTCNGVLKLFDKNRKSSYSQFGEDIIIRNYLNADKSGFYVDIGCSYPFRLSNTMALYQQGWRGLCVDGNPALIELFRHMRPRDTSICSCVSNKKEAATFYVSKYSELSTLSRDKMEDIMGDIHIEDAIEVITTTAQDLFEKNDVPKQFDLLSIDVEGSDFDVLTSFDLNEYRPRVIIIEMHGFDFDNPRNNSVYEYLTKNDYKLANFAVFSGIFVSSA